MDSPGAGVTVLSVAVAIPPNIRGRLGTLEPYFEDPTVFEILVLGPDRVQLTEASSTRTIDLDLSASRIRRLAKLLLRAIGVRSRQSSSVCSGFVGTEWEAQVVGSPEGRLCPRLRLLRVRTDWSDLESLYNANKIRSETLADLKRAASARRSILVIGPARSGKTTLLRALCRTWARELRVGVLEDQRGQFDPSLELSLVADEGPGAGVALGADVLVSDSPLLNWSRLLLQGRAFVATMESNTPEAAIQRILARLMVGAPDKDAEGWSRLIDSTVDTVVELRRGVGEEWIRLGHAPKLEPSGRSVHPQTRSVTQQLSVPKERRQDSALGLTSPAGLGGAGRPAELGASADDGSQRPLSEIRAEQLVSRSFVMRLHGSESNKSATVTYPTVDTEANLVLDESIPEKSSELDEASDEDQGPSEEEDGVSTLIGERDKSDAAAKPLVDLALPKAETTSNLEEISSKSERVRASRAETKVTGNGKASGASVSEENAVAPVSAQTKSPKPKRTKRGAKKRSSE